MTKHPSYCCQSCGNCIGWIGRALQIIGLSPHSCATPRVVHKAYTNMTPEQAAAFDKVFDKMDATFKEMDRAFKTLR